MRGPALYELLRHLTLPVVAVTTAAGGRTNGMIANSAQRASLVPDRPRISLYILKSHYTHQLVWSSGIFAVHLLRMDQWDVVRRLGLASGRESEKLADLAIAPGVTRCPLLTDAAAAFECRVVNTMDAGALTFFLGDVVEVRTGLPGPVLTSERFRDDAPADLRRAYEVRLAETQRALASLSDAIAPTTWPGPTVEP